MSRSSKYVAAGVRSDVEKLLNAFVATGDKKFQGFAKIWKEMKFTLIFVGRENKGGLAEFTQECFRIAISYLDIKNSFELNIASFFLLYAFYIKQPGTVREKIRVKLEDWRRLQAIIKESEEKELCEVSYLFHLLCEDCAFHFVYRSNLLGPRTSLMYREVSNTEKRWDSITHELKSLLKNGELPHISSLHDKYNESKKVLDPSTLKALTLVADNVASRAVTNIKKFLSNKQVSLVDNVGEFETDHSDDSDAVSVNDDVGARRAVLKDKMFRARPTTGRSRRHRVVVSDDSDTSPRKKKERLRPV